MKEQVDADQIARHSARPRPGHRGGDEPNGESEMGRVKGAERFRAPTRPAPGTGEKMQTRGCIFRSQGGTESQTGACAWLSFWAWKRTPDLLFQAGSRAQQTAPAGKKRIFLNRTWTILSTDLKGKFS